MAVYIPGCRGDVHPRSPLKTIALPLPFGTATIDAQPNDKQDHQLPTQPAAERQRHPHRRSEQASPRHPPRTATRSTRAAEQLLTEYCSLRIPTHHQWMQHTTEAIPRSPAACTPPPPCCWAATTTRDTSGTPAARPRRTRPYGTASPTGCTPQTSATRGPGAPSVRDGDRGSTYRCAWSCRTSARSWSKGTRGMPHSPRLQR